MRKICRKTGVERLCGQVLITDEVDMDSNGNKKRNDIILIGCLLLVAAAAFALIQLTKKPGGKVSVVQNGKEIASYPLDVDTEQTFISETGGFNKLIIKEGKADIIAADCPDKLCVGQHSISSDGETIVCLPNKLVILVVSDDKPEVDIVF